MSKIKYDAKSLAKEYQKKLWQYATSNIDEKLYNFEFTVSDSSEKVKVQVYFGKKGVKTVLQGNPNSEFYKQLECKISDQQNINFDENKLIDNEPEEYIGADESGKGDFFGPLVTAAVYATKDDLIELRKIGAVDSKLLNDNQIMKLAEKIKFLLKDKFIIRSLVPAEYNRIYSEKKNLNKLLREEHQENIISLLDRYKTKNIIIDSFERKSFVINKDVKIIQTEKAERFTGVAAASILARSEMALWFENNFIKDNYKIPKGASTEVNNFLKKFNSHSIINWSNFCKLHFKNFQNIKM